MRHLFGPLRHLNFWETAAFETNGGGGGGGGNDDKPAKTNQDRINEIYAASDNPWESNGAELNALTQDRSGTFSGTTTTTPSNDDKPAPQAQAKTSSGKDTIGAVSSTGQYAGDGFEFVENEGGYLTRTYTGANEGAGLGQDVISGGTADKNTKEAIANISLNEGSSFAASPASATDGDLLNLFNPDIEGTGRSGSYAEQIGQIDYTPTLTYGASGPAATAGQSFGDAFAANRAAGNETFTYKGDLFTTDLAPEAPVPSLRPQARPGIASLGEDDLMSQPVVGAAGQEYADSLPDFSYDFSATAPMSSSDYLVAAQKRRDAGLDSVISPTSLEATTPTIQVAGPVTELPSSADFAMPGTQQAAYATSMGPGGRDPFDPRTIMPTSEQMAEFKGTAQEPVDMTPSLVESLDFRAPEERQSLVDDVIDSLFLQDAVSQKTGLDEYGKYAAPAVIGATRGIGALTSGVGQTVDQFVNRTPANLELQKMENIPASMQTEAMISAAGEAGLRNRVNPNLPGSQDFYDFGSKVFDFGDTLSARAVETVPGYEANQDVFKGLKRFEDVVGYEGGQIDPRLLEAQQAKNAMRSVYGQGSKSVVPMDGVGFDSSTAVQKGIEGAGSTAPLLIPSLFGPLGVASSVVGGQQSIVGELSQDLDRELSELYKTGRLQQSPNYQRLLASNAGNEAATLRKMQQQAREMTQLDASLLGGGGTALEAALLRMGLPGIAAIPLVEAAQEGPGEALAGNRILEAVTGFGTPVDRKSTIEQTVAGLLGGSGVATGGAVVQGASNLSAAGLPYSGDVLDQFVVDSPTEGQPAQSTVPSSYDAAQLGDGTDPMATSMEAMAAQQIIEDQVNQFGVVDPSILNRLQQSTGLSMEELGAMEASATSTRLTPDQIAAIQSAPVGELMTTAPVSPNLADEVTGIGGGSNISVRPNPDGTITLTNPSGLQTVVESGQSLDEAIQVFDEITTPIDAQTEALKLQAQEEAAAMSGARDVTSTPFKSIRGEGISSLPAASDVDSAPVAPAPVSQPTVMDSAPAQSETPVVKAQDVLAKYNEDIEARPAGNYRTNLLTDAALIEGFVRDSKNPVPSFRLKKGDTVNLTAIAEDRFGDAMARGGLTDPYGGVDTQKLAATQRRLQEAGILGPVDSNGNQELLAEVATEGLASSNTAAIDKKMDADNAAPAPAPAPGTGSLDAAANTSLSTIPTRVVVGDSLDGYSAADVSGQPIGSSKPQDDLDVRGTMGGPFTNMKNEQIGGINNAPYGEPVRRVIDNPDGTTTIQVGSRVSAEGAAGSRDNYVSAAVTLPSSATDEQKAAAYRQAEANWRSNYEGATTSGDIDQNAGKVLPNEDITTFKAITKKMDADNAAPAVEKEDVAAVVEVGGVDPLEEFRERARSDLKKSKTVNNTILSTIESLKSNGLTEEAAAYEAEANAISERNLKARMASSTGAVVTEKADGSAEVEFDPTAAEQVPVEQDVFAADQVEQEAAAIAAEQVVADAAATDTQTAPTVVVSQVTDDGEDEEVEVEVKDKVEDKVADTGGGVTVEVDGDDTFVPTITTTDEDGNTVTECPEGYTMVDGPDGPMCQKSVTTQRMRAGASTRPYTGLAGNIGRVGPGQRRKTTTTTQTIRA